LSADKPKKYKPDKRKQSVYLPRDMADTLQAHAKRLDRSLSWVVQQLYLGSRHLIEAMPDVALKIGDGRR
jgi:uncharacterized small protein (TIGR04563 family)